MDQVGAGGDGNEAAHLRRLIESAPVIVVTVDGGGVITWVGGAVVEMTGWDAGDLLGTNILDHMVVDWNPMAFESVGFAMTRHGLQRPMLFKVRRKDGSTFVGEVTANAQMDDPLIEGLVAYIRRWDERHLLDLVIEKLAAGASVDETFGLLVDVMGAETLEADGMVLLEPFAGRFSRVVASTAVPAELAADGGAIGSPWHQAALTGEPRCTPVSELPASLRQVAEGHDYAWCWAWPAHTREGAEACLVLWRRVDEEPDFTCRWLLDNLVRVTGLVLEREQAATRLRHAASHDVLTGLANRARFFEHLRTVLADARSGPLVGVLYVDLDEFKPVNDRLGHRAGDRAARRGGQAAGPGGARARSGGPARR